MADQKLYLTWRKTEQAIDLGNLSLFRLNPSFERTLHLADLRVVHLGTKLLQWIVWVASGVAKATAFWRKHLTWFLAYFEHAHGYPSDRIQGVPLSKVWQTPQRAGNSSGSRSGR